MKKSLKIIGYILLSLFIFIMILVVTASLSQKKIVGIVLNKINQSINLPIEIDDLSFTLIKRFPHATFEFSGVKIGAVKSLNSTEKSTETEDILDIKSVYVSVKTMPLIHGIYEIIKVEIDGAELNYKVDSLGISNIDFLLNGSSTDSVLVDTTATLPTLKLKKVKLTNTAVFYRDNKIQAAANLFSHSLEIEGKFENDNFNGTVKGNLDLTECSYDSTNLNQMEKATFGFMFDYYSDTLQIKSFHAISEGLQFGITGKTTFANDMFADIAINTKEVDLEKLLKYVPAELKNEFGVEEVKGMMQISGNIKGNISDSIMPGVNLELQLTDGSTKIKEYPGIRNLSFNGTVNNGSNQNNKTTSLNFKSLHAETDSSTLDLTLSLNNFDKPKYALKSKLFINIEEFKNYIPDTLIQDISGKIIAEISTKGVAPDSIDDNFINLVANNSTAKFDFTNFNINRDSLNVNNFSASVIYSPGQLEVNNLTVLIPSYNINLTNSSFNATYTGPVTQIKDLEIDFKSFYVKAPQGNIQGSAKIKNPEHPDFVVDATALFNLAELKPFIPDSLIHNISGNLAAEIHSRGKLKLDSVSEQITNIILNQSDLIFDAKNISLTMIDTLQKITDLAGVVKIANNRILISQLKGIAADINFFIDSATIVNINNAVNNNQPDTILISKISGAAEGMDFSIDSVTIFNAYNAVINNQHQTVSAFGNIKLGDIDYSLLSPLLATYSTENGTDTPNNSKENTANKSETLNFNYLFKGKIAAKSVKYEKVLLKDISAKLNVCDSVYIIDQFKTNSFDGSANSSLRYSKTSDGKQIINIKSLMDRMDINKILFAFDNFGYDTLISYENLSGRLSSDLHCRFVFDADTLVTSDMRMMGDFTLENGRLINYQPAMDVASFTGIKELDNIELKTVKSSVFLFKNKMYVPATDVVSTSMDFSVFGMQSFGEDFEYHMQLKLGEVLKGKSKKLLERQKSNGDEISKDEKDKNTIKVIYANMEGKEKTGFDSKKLQKNMEVKIQVQQKMLDLIFHPKLVSFETGVQ